jgi:hypothetical protein
MVPFLLSAVHDGDIRAENTDSGPVFSFVLPLRCNNLFQLGNESETV